MTRFAKREDAGLDAPAVREAAAVGAEACATAAAGVEACAAVAADAAVCATAAADGSGCSRTGRLRRSRRVLGEGVPVRLPRRLAASVLVLACALALAAGATLASAAPGMRAPEQSTGGSVLGILVENAPDPDDVESGKFTGNDSNLGIRVASVADEDVTVTFMAQGVVYHEETIGYGALAVAPTRAPFWDWSLDTGGLEEGTAAAPTFDVWCADAAGTQAFDFSQPVTRDTTLYASWNRGDTVEVALHGLGGVMDDPAGGGEVGDVTLVRSVGLPYRSLPTPRLAGYGFRGWHTSDGRQSGDWGSLVAPTDLVRASVTDLYARWEANTYWVRYVNNNGVPGGGPAHDVPMTYDGTGQTFLGWEDVKAQGFYEPAGKRFDGWNTRPDGSGTWYAAASPVPNLTDVAGAYVSLFAYWVDDGTVEEGPFDVTFKYNDGVTADVVVSGVEKGTPVAEPAVPKRTGYQFAGWYADEALTSPWDFGAQVLRTLTLWAKWELRLDVTVPVSVAFAVDADSGAVSAPEPGRYALKSRTVAPVTVERLAVESWQDELDAFFELAPDGGADGEGAATAARVAAPGRADGAPGPWQAALGETALSVGVVGDAAAIELTLADGDGAGAGANGGAGSWSNAHVLTPEEWTSFGLAAFDYGALPDDAGWAGEERCEKLPLRLDLRISDRLSVKFGQPGAVPITHLKVTVSARA